MAIRQKKRKKRSNKPNKIIYIISVLIMIGLIFHSIRLYSQVAGYTFLPEKYIKLALIALVIINAFFSVYAFFPVNNLNKILQSILCTTLCVCMVFGQTTLTSYVGKLERLFTDIPTEGELNINVYTMADSGIGDLESLRGKTIAVQTQIDADYEKFAINLIKQELGQDAVTVAEYTDMFAALDALYSGEVDAMLLNQSYEELITDNEDYKNFTSETAVAYTCMQRVSLEYDDTGVGDITTEPFIIVVGGNDSYYYTNVMNDTGRTDVNILCCVNPTTKQILLVTIPRDSYVNLWANSSCPDKLTHATVYGIDCWESAIEEKLDIEINYYIRVCFSSIINIVDAVGGITINNPYAFTADCYYDGYTPGQNYYFAEGELYMNGYKALCYCRHRHGLEGGDMGRNQHQAIVIKALINKIISVDGITHITDLMDAVNGTFKTDITTNQLYALAQMQLNDMASWTLNQYSITGVFGSEPSYAMGLNSGRTFDVVYLDEGTVATAQKYIAQVMNGEEVVIE